MISTRLFLSKFFSLCTNRLVTVPSTPITVGIPVTSCSIDFQLSSKFKELISLFTFLQLYPVVSRTAKSSIRLVLFLCWLSLGLVVWPKLNDLFVSQNLKEFCASHFLGWILSCAYTICLRVKFKPLAQFPVDHLAHPAGSTIMYMLYSHNHNHDINPTVYIQIHIQTQDTGGLYCLTYERFINLFSSVLRHEERDTTLTMLTIPNARRILWCLRSLSEKKTTTSSTAQSQLLTDSFSKSSNSQPIFSGHDVIHTPTLFPVGGLLWQWWLSYPLRASVKLYPMAMRLNSLRE